MNPWTTLRVEEAEDRLVVTLDAPHRNAISLEMVQELHGVLDGLEQSPGRVLVLTGSAGAFAGGADIAQLRERTRDDALAGINLRLFDRLSHTPMPTVAAIDGFALGGGAELAYACDVRVASTRAVFGQPEPRLGIMAAAGGCYRLAGLVGRSLAGDMLLTGRTLNAEEALSAGLVSRVVPEHDLLPAAHRVVDEMSRGSRIALRLTKLALNAPPGAHPAIELTGQAVLFEDAEKHERMTAFLQRRGAA